MHVVRLANSRGLCRNGRKSTPCRWSRWRVCGSQIDDRKKALLRNKNNILLRWSERVLGVMDKLKQQTMMRLGELQCFDEQQRIDIFEMVKQGAISVEV